MKKNKWRHGCSGKAGKRLLCSSSPWNEQTLETKFLRIKHTPCTCTEYLSKSFKLQTKGSKTHLKSPKKQLLGSSKMKNYNTPKNFLKNA